MARCNDKTKIIVVFIGPHPDDIEIGAGGTIAFLIESGKYEVWCIILTKGEQGLGTNNGLTIRAQESQESLALLGVSEDHIIFGDFLDTQIPNSVETIRFLEKFSMINNRQIHTVYIPSTKDTHQDHRAAALASLTAFRNVRQILAYESPSVMTEFSPTSFVDITKFFVIKKNALRCHKSQTEQAKIYLEYKSMLCVSAFRGMQIGVKFAEAFETIKNLIEP